MPWLAVVLLSQLLSPYAGVTWKGPLPVLDATTAAKIGARLKKGGDVKPAPKAPLTGTDFKPAGPRTAAALLVSHVQGLSRPRAAALIEGLNAGIDSFELALRKNNVAYALAFLIGIAKQVATDREVAAEETETLAQAVNDELAASPTFKKTSPADRQLLYETCIVVGSLIGGIAAEAADSSDTRLQNQARELAVQALASFGR